MTSETTPGVHTHFGMFPKQNTQHLHSAHFGTLSKFFNLCFYVHRCLPLFISVHRCCLQSPENSSGTGTSNGCEPPCGCRSLNSGPVEEQPVLLTSEPSLLPCQYSLFKPSPALLLNSLFCIQHTQLSHTFLLPLWNSHPQPVFHWSRRIPVGMM